MVLRHLSTQQMVTLSQYWLDPSRERPVIEKYPMGKATLPHVERAHNHLIAFHRRGRDSQREIAKIQTAQAKLDAIHDAKIRGVHGYLTAAAELADTEEEAQRYLDLRKALLPDGLRAVTRSYADQGGEIILLKERLRPEIIDALRAIPTPNGSLYSHVEAWIKAGRELSDLHSERLDILKTIGESEVRGADVIRARHEWVRVVRALRNSLELDNVTPEDREKVFRYLESVALASRSRKGSAATSTVEEPPKSSKAPADPAKESPTACVAAAQSEPETP